MGEEENQKLFPSTLIPQIDKPTDLAYVKQSYKKLLRRREDRWGDDSGLSGRVIKVLVKPSCVIPFAKISDEALDKELINRNIPESTQFVN
jgi:Glu-tRNA(Gln) amidotransferase subunit E-like FAD-binding protein